MATTDQPTPLVVCDAGPLIHLDEVGCLDLLRGYGAVRDKITRLLASGEVVRVNQP